VKITVLSENTAGAGFLAEHGLSYLIEHNGNCLLFDTGASDVFLKNADKLNLDVPSAVDTVVLSHGHWDHGNGLQHLHGQKLVTHSKSFIKRYRKGNDSEVGLDFTEEYAREKFNLILSSEPLRIYKDVWYLGEIPRENDFEAQTTTFVDEDNNPDFVPDDSALAFIEENSLVVITGCSHSGICNIINQAQIVTGIQKVKAVMGGFHLKKNNEQTHKTIQFFKRLGVEEAYPSHCVELEAL
jgi:7,8-dihydropterin-6-yl-methyl-4-(beta-D-ribofuranosyl)aminobenzene 5'-phosphate synthase